MRLFRSLLLPALLSLGAPVVANEAPAPDAAPWQQAFPARTPSSDPVVKSSIYIPMRDGTRIAVDVYHQQGAGPGARVPTILNLTRYWRAFAAKSDPVGSCRAISPFAAYFASRGYAIVMADVRGTGASFGTRSGELDANELADGTDVINWITRQPWSDGKVGSTGISYGGTAAEYLPVLRHPAVKAVAPISTLIDAYADLYFPGGVPNTVFRDGWSTLNRTLDAGRGPDRPDMAELKHPCPVDGDDDLKLLHQAIAEHAPNFDSGAATRGMAHRDDNDTFAVRLPSSYQRRAEIDAADVPFLSIEGWFDSGYARAGINRFIASTSRQQRLIIAAASHGIGYHGGPGVSTPIPSAFDFRTEVLAFFDHYLAGRANGYDAQPRVRWFTTGSNTWASADTWDTNPPKTRLCLTAQRDLATTGRCGARTTLLHRPSADGAPGTATRWDATISGGPVIYPERSAADRALLHFDGPALTAPLHLLGAPVLELALTTSAARADVFAWLEEVDSAGHARVIADGMVRANYSRSGSAPYPAITPQPSGLARDDKASIAGQPQRLMIAFEPLAHVVAAGNHLRLTLAASDSRHFTSPAATGSSWRIGIGNGASRLELPLARPSTAPQGPGR